MSSFFSRTAISRFSAIVAPFFALGSTLMSRHLDRLGLFPLGRRQEKSENAVAILGFDAVRIDLEGQADRAIKPAGEPLPSMQRRLLRIADLLAAGQTNGAALHLHIDLGLFHAGNLGDDDEVVPFSKHVDRRIGTAAAQARIEPTARPKRIQSLLKARQRVERIREYSHCSSSLRLDSETRRAISPRCAFLGAQTRSANLAPRGVKRERQTDAALRIIAGGRRASPTKCWKLRSGPGLPKPRSRTAVAAVITSESRGRSSSLPFPVAVARLRMLISASIAKARSQPPAPGWRGAVAIAWLNNGSAVIALLGH